MADRAPRSPGRLALERLLANPVAVAGALIIAIVVTLVAGAPLFTVFSPEEQRIWLGAQKPGYSHPDVLNLNRFVLGQPAETSLVLRQAQAVDLTWSEQSVEGYRIVLRRGKVASIQSHKGANAFDELVLGNQGSWRLDADGNRDPLPALEVRRGELPPPGLVPTGSRVVLVETAGEETRHIARISLQEGTVSAMTSTKAEFLDSLELGGPLIIEAVADGRPASVTRFLGTDTLGRDVWSRVLYGGQISLLVGVVATAVSLVIGVFYGALAGWASRRTDGVMMRIVDILYGLPFMFLVILLLVYFGRNMIVLFIALGAVQWLTMARIVRSQVLTLKNREFIAAATLSGSTSWGTLIRHILPNCAGPIVVYATLTVPLVILEESFLAFIGLKVESGGRAIDSWGSLVDYGITHAGEGLERWWLLAVPVVAMTGTLLALNAFGSGLRDAVDVRIRGAGS